MSSIARNQVFSAVHTVGSLLPADLLIRVSEGKDIDGSAPADYRVVGSRSVRDEAERHWDYLRSVWSELRAQLPATPQAEVPADSQGLAISQWLAPLFAELGFGALTAVGQYGIASDDDSKTFPISHRWNHVPIHLTTWNSELDKRGSDTVPPQSLVQEMLNRTDAHLWGVVTNGRQLRLLRDSNALATAAYVEFDLEAIFDGELFSEFVLLYRLLHVSRFEISDGAGPATCWLERWRLDAISSGTRALDQLRDGVEEAIKALGTGFLRHPANTTLRENIDAQTLHHALLRLVYRLLFVFVVEDRELLHPPIDPKASPETRQAAELARDRYATYFSMAKLRAHARRRRGTAHDDLYRALRLVLDALGNEHGSRELALPGLGGIFDRTDADSPLDGLALSNEYLLAAVRNLDRVRDPDLGRLRSVDYQHLGAEELGSVYESLLERVPEHRAADRAFDLVPLPGNERKKTGSYYTPTSLIETLLNSSLDPVIDDAQKRGEQRAAIEGKSETESVVDELLALTVCDPACGSGHFLVAAARRIAKRVAAVREGNPEPTVDSVRRALHEVIAHCIYGVDLNPMAVELVKVALWLEAMEPGAPLNFLDAHIKLGNGLIGTTPSLISGGIPDKAFKAVEGDDTAVARRLQAQNEAERAEQFGLFELEEKQINVANSSFATELRDITTAQAHTLTDVRRQAARYDAWENSPEYRHARHVADAWCAAFVWHKTDDAPPAITHHLFRELNDPSGTAAPQATHDEVVRLREEYRFFHWHLAFPDVFRVSDDSTDVDPRTGWAGGFDCVLGNPPWDKVDFEDKKYFSVVEPDIAAISGTDRGHRIAEWEEEFPEKSRRYRAARRKVKSSFLYLSSSGTFPLCGAGLTVKGVNSLQTDQLFAERFATIVEPTGRAGCVIPTAIGTGAASQYLFADFTRRGAIELLYDFENSKPLFPGVHRSYKFCLFSFVGQGMRVPEARFAFFLQSSEDLDEDPQRAFLLRPEEISLINPNTGNLPIFRSRRDADLTAAIYHRIPVLWDETTKSGNRWQIVFKRLFDMTDDSDLFRKRADLEDDGWQLAGNVFTRSNQRMLPLYEGKMVHHFDHRWNSYYGSGDEDQRRLDLHEKQSARAAAMPRYWIQETGSIKVVRKGKPKDIPGVTLQLDEVAWNREWLCGWRDVARSTDARTAVPAFLPRAAVGHTLPLMLPHVDPKLVTALIAAQSSIVVDFVSRQKSGGIHMALMTWKQLPVPDPPTIEPHTPFITPRVLELAYTAHDMAGLARDLDDEGEPFRWDEERRAQIQAELDAYFFHIYGINRDDVDYILETFQSDSGGGLKNNDIKQYGTYRTKDLVLAEYDKMQPEGLSLESPLEEGETYTSPLNPPPGHGPRHPARDT